jgi:hypothetical protein
MDNPRSENKKTHFLGVLNQREIQAQKQKRTRDIAENTYHKESQGYFWLKNSLKINLNEKILRLQK